MPEPVSQALTVIGMWRLIHHIGLVLGLAAGYIGGMVDGHLCLTISLPVPPFFVNLGFIQLATVQ
jgi:ABC-type dipeptide/oligopeptide/nickel transport system permease subunit